MVEDNQDFTDVIKLCQELILDPVYANRARNILTKLMPDKIKYDINDNVSVAYNEYTFYSTVIEDIRYYESSYRGYPKIEVEYLVSVNIYDCPVKQWIPQIKIFPKSPKYDNVAK